MINPRPYQIEAVNAVLENFGEGIDRQLISLPTGCHAKGTKILMFDGALKNVEDIVVGDLLMGQDSTPRKVLSLTHGVDEMFRIVPIKGTPFVVNSAHILSLKKTNERSIESGRVYSSTLGGGINNIAVSDYLLKSSQYKHLYKLYRVAVNFPEKSVSIDPYFMGVVLGDGSTTNNCISITKPDAEIEEECRKQAQIWNLDIREEQREGRTKTFFFVSKEGRKCAKHSNLLRNSLVQLGLNGLKSGRKFVPEIYKINSRNVRLNILAGLLDTDGYSNGRGGFEFSSKSVRLANDVVFLSRSTGMAAYLSTKPVDGEVYYRVTISGDCSIIPTRIPRKKAAPRLQKKNVLTTGFGVEPVGKGEYYGFQVDGDNLYIMGDFTVTHNCGKTVAFGLLVKSLDCGTLILAHREELLTQARDKLRMINPNLDIGILKAEERDGLRRQVCIASVQTAIRHIPELKARDFSLMIIDEAHHSAANSYKQLIKDLEFCGGSGKLLVGVTATAFRGDKQALGDVFEKIVYEKTIQEMIHKGYLCDVRGIQVGTDVNLSDIHTRSGDFALDELEVAVDTPERNKLIVDAYQKYCDGKKAVTFAVSVEHAHKIMEAFTERGISCNAVWGSQNNDVRKAVIDSFLNGGYRVLSNCMILTEGFDAPDIEAVLMARPTKSHGLYIQCVGRGLRLAPGKKECLVLDFVDASGKHSLCNVGTLTGKQPKSGESVIEAEEREREEREEREKRIPKAPERKITQEADLFHRSRIAWSGGLNGIYRIMIDDGGSIVCAPNECGYEAYWLKGNGEVKPVTDGTLTLEWAQGVAEDFARKITATALIDKTARWRADPATDKQIEQLTRYRIPYKNDITKGEAVDLMTDAFNQPATDKQIWCIRTNRLHDYPHLLTKKMASRIISEHKNKLEGLVHE